TPTCARNSPRPTSKPGRRRGRIFAARTGRRCSSPIAAAQVIVSGLLEAIVTARPLQVIVTGRLIAIGPPQVIAIDPGRVVEIGRKLATPGVAKTLVKEGLAK